MYVCDVSVCVGGECVGGDDIQCVEKSVYLCDDYVSVVVGGVLCMW